MWWLWDWRPRMCLLFKIHYILGNMIRRGESAFPEAVQSNRCSDEQTQVFLWCRTWHKWSPSWGDVNSCGKTIYSMASWECKTLSPWKVAAAHHKVEHWSLWWCSHNITMATGLRSVSSLKLGLSTSKCENFWYNIFMNPCNLIYRVYSNFIYQRDFISCYLDMSLPGAISDVLERQAFMLPPECKLLAVSQGCSQRPKCQLSGCRVLHSDPFARSVPCLHPLACSVKMMEQTENCLH